MAARGFPVAVYNITQTVGTTSWPANQSTYYNEYAHCDVIAVVNTIAGSGVSIQIQEAFPVTNGVIGTLNSAFLTTAKAVNITATGAYYMTYDNNNLQANTPYAAPATQQNSMLGKGTVKQIVTTAGAVTAFNMDVVFVFWN